MRQLVVLNDDGSIRAIYPEEIWKALQRLHGKTEQEIEAQILKLEDYVPGNVT